MCSLYILYIKHFSIRTYKKGQWRKAFGDFTIHQLTSQTCVLCEVGDLSLSLSAVSKSRRVGFRRVCCMTTDITRPRLFFLLFLKTRGHTASRRTFTPKTWDPFRTGNSTSLSISAPPPPPHQLPALPHCNLGRPRKWCSHKWLDSLLYTYTIVHTNQEKRSGEPRRSRYFETCDLSGATKSCRLFNSIPPRQLTCREK